MSRSQALTLAIGELRRRRNNLQRHRLGRDADQRATYLAQLGAAIAVLEALARIVDAGGLSGCG